MLKFILNISILFLIIISNSAKAQFGSSAATCIWSGTLANCLPSSGILLRNQRQVRFGEATGNGSNYAAIQAPASLAGDYTLTLPVDDGTTGQALSTDGSGVLSWANVSTFSGSSTNNAVAKYNGTAGALQNSGVIIDSSNNTLIPGQLDIQSSLGNSQFNISTGSTNEGFYITNFGSINSTLSFGAERVGANWTARGTSAGLLEFTSNGVPFFYQNTGLTPGNTFSPSVYTNVDTSGRWIFYNGAFMDDDANQDVLNYYREEALTSTFSGNGGGTASPSRSVTATRVGRIVTVVLEGTDTAGTSSSNIIISNTNLPSWARPSADSYGACGGLIEGGVNIDVVGTWQVTTAGRIGIFRTPSGGTNWSNASNNGWRQFTMTFSI